MEQERDDIAAFLSGGEPARGPDLGPVFRAGYDSECSECWDRIDEGDDIRAAGGDFIHAECTEDWLSGNS